MVVLSLMAGGIWYLVVSGRSVPAHDDELKANGPKTSLPSQPPATPADSLTDLCIERATRLAEQLDRPCQLILRPPFVLGGDLSEAELQDQFQQTIRPACDALVASYFRQLPDGPVTILMFSTEAAYRRAAEQLFFDRSVSRFGYYKPGRRTVLVNLAEGDGGLLHELTHVLMDADFPDAPRWLQEGMASLHEARDIRAFAAESDSNSGTHVTAAVNPTKGALFLVPRHNWRWTVLRCAVAEGRLPTVQSLIAESPFRGSTEALDYAYARYFCWFLHEQRKLRQLYVALRERSGVARDANGGELLLDVLSADGWESVDQGFRAWLEKLAPPPS